MRTGVRSNPFFKPDWNPELFLGQNFINHLGVYRADLLREIGGFREGFEGSQDYDLALALRRTAAAGAGAAHSAHSLSLADGGRQPGRGSRCETVRERSRAPGDRGSSANAAACRARWCRARKMSNRTASFTSCRSRRRSLRSSFRCAIESDLLERCVESIRARTDYRPFEIVIVDNGSVEAATLEFFRGLERENSRRVSRLTRAIQFQPADQSRARRRRSGDVLVFLEQRHRSRRSRLAARKWSAMPCGRKSARSARGFGIRTARLQHGGVILGLGGVAGHAFPHIPRGHPGYFNRAYAPAKLLGGDRRVHGRAERRSSRSWADSMKRISASLSTTSTSACA